MADFRIAIATPAFPHPGAGFYPGIERQSIELTRMLCEAGSKVEVFTTYWNGGTAIESYGDATIRRLPDTRAVFGRPGALLDMHFVTWSRFAGDAILGSGAFDLVHSLAPLSSSACLRRARLPLITSFHHFERTNSWVDLLYKPVHHWLEREAYAQSNLVLAPSTYSADELTHALHVPVSHVRVIPHSIDTKRFHTISKVSSADEGVRALYVGIHEERKGLRYLLEALRELHLRGLNISLVTVGGGPQRAYLNAYARNLGISHLVEFRGYVHDPAGTEIPKIYSGFDMFVFPSTHEGFGFVLLEAMASGLAIVSTTASAIPEVVGDAGILVPPRDFLALANAMEILANDPMLRQSLGRKARSRVAERFSTRSVTREILDAYDFAIRRSAASV